MGPQNPEKFPEIASALAAITKALPADASVLRPFICACWLKSRLDRIQSSLVLGLEAGAIGFTAEELDLAREAVGVVGVDALGVEYWRV